MKKRAATARRPKVIAKQECVKGILWDLTWRWNCKNCRKEFTFKEVVTSRHARRLPRRPDRKPYCDGCYPVFLEFEMSNPLLLPDPTKRKRIRKNLIPTAPLEDCVEWREQAVLRLNWLLWQSQQRNQVALLELLTVARVAVDALNLLTNDHPVLCRKAAEKTLLWPGFISKNKGIQEYGMRLAKKLNVGGGITKPAKYDVNAPSTVAAQGLAAWLRKSKEALELPAPSENTYNQWFDVGWRAVLMATAGRPEDHPGLRPIGERAPSSRDPAKFYMPEMTEGLAQTLIRDRIKTVLKHSLRLWLLQTK